MHLICTAIVAEDTMNLLMRMEQMMHDQINLLYISFESLQCSERVVVKQLLILNRSKCISL
jgi:hypothetical protein